MTLEDLQSLLLPLKNITEDIKWGNDLCYSVGGKMFLVITLNVFPIPASFKTEEESFDGLIERDGVMPAPYLAKHKWVKVNDINHFSKKEWRKFIHQSYELVKAKLPRNKP